MNVLWKSLKFIFLLPSFLVGTDLPNVVIIYADDMGYGDLGANHAESKIPTPHLDRLATEGMRFLDGHSSSGICTPSRFALLTGQHHWRRFHRIVGAMGESVFKSDDYTLAKMFKSKGYQTACIGKWHLGWNWDSLLKEGASKPTKGNPARPEHYDWSRQIPDGPLAQGFDYYFGDGTINFPPYCWVENDRVVEAPTVMMDSSSFRSIPEGKWEFRSGPMVEGWDPYEVLPVLTKKAVEWVKKQKKDQPFFLYFPLSAPHAPIIPNEEFLGKSEAGSYGDFVCQVDDLSGEILNALEQGGFSDHTIVVFTADNGAEKYAFNRLKKHDHWSSGSLRGLKRDVWEGGHRVPFLIRWPGKIEKGAVSDETISQVDLAATFAQLIGYDLKSDEAVDSYNLLPLLQGEKYEKPLREATVQNTFDRAFAIRQGDWVYIDAATGEHSKAPEWVMQEQGYEPHSTPGLLFNLKIDLSQHHNVYAQYPERVEKMKALLERYKSGEGCAPHAK